MFKRFKGKRKEPNLGAGDDRDSEINTVRIARGVPSIKKAILNNLLYLQGRFPEVATRYDYYMAIAHTVRDYLVDNWNKTAQVYLEQASRTVCYFSAEFLIGPQLGNNLYNIDLYEQFNIALAEMNIKLDDILAEEPEPGLGNGGLGRLAACYMDSLATLGIAAVGYGIRYEFGIFDQAIVNGWQVEKADKWLRYGNPWEIPRPEVSFDIKFGGRTEWQVDENNNHRINWIADEVVKSVAYDTPIIGCQGNTTNFIRLWKAEARKSFDFNFFNQGDYYGAVQDKLSSENITKVLYPNDELVAGKVLRLKQQIFFVSSSLQDMLRLYRRKGRYLGYFCDKFVVQLNDTHPAIAIAELMRLLIDEYQISWEQAWEITGKTFCYTNHTLLPEALEKWSLSLFAKLLPRHLSIIYEINQRFLSEIQLKVAGDLEKIRKLSIIDESDEKQIRMANLACIGSKAINGVSKLHSELLKELVLKDFYDIWPEKFSNVTNGVTQRRFLLLTNNQLASFITKSLGSDRWVKDFDEIKKLESFSKDSGFIEQWQKIKLENKNKLAMQIMINLGVKIDPSSLFDVQVKRIHEYKRQTLNLLHVIHLYNKLKNNPSTVVTPRTVIFAGKAAPAYHKAKLLIKLINEVANKINYDPLVKEQLKVVFIPNFNVKNSQTIYPAADLSEQISTAGMEASGTGNMKFAINGALTIGTLDGANVEILEELGRDNFYLFGLTAQEVLALKKTGNYTPGDYISRDQDLQAVFELLRSNYFMTNSEIMKPLIDDLFYQDTFMVCADFRSYVDTQEIVAKDYSNSVLWTKKSILSTARMGKFSSDRSISEYSDRIWEVKPVLF